MCALLFIWPKYSSSTSKSKSYLKNNQREGKQAGRVQVKVHTTPPHTPTGYQEQHRCYRCLGEWVRMKPHAQNRVVAWNESQVGVGFEREKWKIKKNQFWAEQGNYHRQNRFLVRPHCLLIYRCMFYLEYLCKNSPYIQGQISILHFLVSLHSMHKINTSTNQQVSLFLEIC